MGSGKRNYNSMRARFRKRKKDESNPEEKKIEISKEEHEKRIKALKEAGIIK